MRIAQFSGSHLQMYNCVIRAVIFLQQNIFSSLHSKQSFCYLACADHCSINEISKCFRSITMQQLVKMHLSHNVLEINKFIFTLCKMQRVPTYGSRLACVEYLVLVPG